MTEIDVLTGLYTREAFCSHAEQRVRQFPDNEYCIVISDFVNFKHFNSRYGVDLGDLLLKSVGKMLQNVNNGAIFGRYGADRFAALVPKLNNEAISYLDNFKLPEAAETEFPVSSIIVKFGVCDCVTGENPISFYCDRALIAVQSVKHQYGKNVAVYDDDSGSAINREIIIEETMAEALDKRQFTVYYQPQMDINNGRLSGAEALVRWNHPKLGFMNPNDFIPFFEKNGFIYNLDLYVFEKICSDIDEWRGKGMKAVPISVNLSQKDLLFPNLIDNITEIAARYNIDNTMVHFEITESCRIDFSENARNNVVGLKKLGYIIEMDDFGSGYSSLASIDNTLLDVLKIDMTLLRKKDFMASNSVLNAALNLAKMLNLRTIQEGVETEEQLEHLKTIGCDCIQGFYYSKPLPKEKYEMFQMSNIV